MHLIAWMLGCASKLTALGAVASRRWHRALPCFSAYILIISLMALSNAFWQLLMNDSATANKWYGVLGVAMSGARLAAYVEAFYWFATSLPRFRIVGWGVFILTTSVGVFATVSLDRPISSAAYALVGALGQWTGAVVAVGCIASLLVFRAIGGELAASRRHAMILAAWNASSTAGWYMMGHGHGMAGGWLMIMGDIACPAMWVWLIQEKPSWAPPAPIPGTLPKQKIQKEFEQALKATSGR